MDEPNDPDLLAAIAASLRDQPQHKENVNASAQGSPHELVDLTVDSDNESDLQVLHPKSKSVVSSETETGDDDDDLRRALQLSMESSSRKTILESQAVEDESLLGHLQIRDRGSLGVAHAPQTVSATASAGLPGLDRKQMEQERLARNAKRNAKRKAQDSESASPAQPIRKAAKTDSLPTAPPETTGLEQTSPSRPVHRPSVNPRKPARAHAPEAGTPSRVRPGSDICWEYASNAPGVNIWPTSRPVAQWPLGAVKKTHIAGFPRTGNEITIEEVIQRDDVELAVFSSFLWDMEWLFRKLNTSSTRFVLTMQADDQETVRVVTRLLLSLYNTDKTALQRGRDTSAMSPQCLTFACASLQSSPRCFACTQS